MERGPYSWGDPEGFLKEEGFELSFGGWLLTPFGFIISKNTVRLLCTAAMGGSAGGVCLD